MDAIFLDKSRQQPRKAFTLLEVILAVSIIVFISAVAFVFYQNVIRARTKSLERIERLTYVQAVFDRLSRELRSAIIVDPDYQAGLHMEAARLEFTTVTLPQVGYMEDGTVTQDEAIPPSFDVVKADYRLLEDQTDDGETVVIGLGINYDKMVFADTVLSEASYSLFGNLRFVNFRYYQNPNSQNSGQISGGVTQNGWRGTWSGPTLPTAVEVTIGYEPIEAGQTIESYLEKNEYYRRVIYIPSSL